MRKHTDTGDWGRNSESILADMSSETVRVRMRSVYHLCHLAEYLVSFSMS